VPRFCSAQTASDSFALKCSSGKVLVWTRTIPARLVFWPASPCARTLRSWF